MHLKKFTPQDWIAASGIVIIVVVILCRFYQTSQPPVISPDEHQLAYAQEAQLPVEQINQAGMVMRLIPPGFYQRGSPKSEIGHTSFEYQHDIIIKQAFYMSATEITQAQYIKVMSSNPSFFNRFDDLPVEQVSWVDAVHFCNELSRQENLSIAYKKINDEWVCFPKQNGYRIPLEIEWEYACRAGSIDAFYSGEITTENQAKKNMSWIGWYQPNAKGRSHKVGLKLPNAWGLYDMSGNLWEWCWDLHNAYPLKKVNPLGPKTSGVGRVLRGGCWYSDLLECRSANRKGNDPFEARNIYGMRCVRTVQPSPKTH